jgi:hypothetical protein
MSQSRREKRENERRFKKEMADMAKKMSTTVVDMGDDFSTHYGPQGSTTIEWLKPTLISKEIRDNKMYLQLLWGGKILEGKPVDGHGSTIALSIIGKGKTGKFVYNTDTPQITLNTVFDELDQLLWEYEIPRELKQEILDLPNSDMSEVFSYDNEKCMSYSEPIANLIAKNNF